MMFNKGKIFRINISTVLTIVSRVYAKKIEGEEFVIHKKTKRIKGPKKEVDTARPDPSSTNLKHAFLNLFPVKEGSNAQYQYPHMFSNVQMSKCPFVWEHENFSFIFMPQFGSKELSTANLPQFPMLKHNFAMPLISRNSSYF